MIKELTVIVSSTWKFAATFPVAIYLFNMSFFETILYTNIGGLIGIIVFTMFLKGMIKIVGIFWPTKFRVKKRQKKVFTKRNRRLLGMKNKYGLPGIVILAPVILSIPVGVFLCTKYYGRKKISYIYLLLSQIAWSFVYTFFYMKVKSAL